MSKNEHVRKISEITSLNEEMWIPEHGSDEFLHLDERDLEQASGGCKLGRPATVECIYDCFSNCPWLANL